MLVVYCVFEDPAQCAWYLLTVALLHPLNEVVSEHINVSWLETVECLRPKVFKSTKSR